MHIAVQSPLKAIFRFWQTHCDETLISLIKFGLKKSCTNCFSTLFSFNVLCFFPCISVVLCCYEVKITYHVTFACEYEKKTFPWQSQASRPSCQRGSRAKKRGCLGGRIITLRNVGKNSQILRNPLKFAFLTIFGCKTPYLRSDVMALYLKLVVRNWVISVCRWASFNTISSLKGRFVLLGLLYKLRLKQQLIKE